MAEQRGLRGFLTSRRLLWRHFWSLRAPWRVNLVKLFAVMAVLIGVYLLIPSSWQSQVNQWLLAAGGDIASLSPIELLASIAGLLVVMCLFLIFVHPHRRATYLATTPFAIPSISVYIDAENQLPPSAIRSFNRFLMEHLDGRRADRLYFLDASQTANSEQYKALYRFGFRPIDVPHDPTGKASVKEAVDKELAMHAYDRALAGPPKQEFIIVTGDQDFVALVYRLVALGHRVQVWATPIRPAYRTLATYLDVNVLDLASVISELQTEPAQSMALTLPVSKETKSSVPAFMGQTKQLDSSMLPLGAARPDVFSYTGEEQLYQAIVETLAARAKGQKRSRSDENRNSAFRSLLGGELGPRLAGVGYRTGNRLDYWIEHLLTLGVLAEQRGKAFPAIGSTSAEAAANAMFAMASVAAKAAVAVAPARADGSVQMSDVATALANALPDSAAVGPLRQLVLGNNPRRATHVRYFVRCAEALGLIAFDDVPGSLDTIHAPHLLEATPLASSDGAADDAVPQDPRADSDTVAKVVASDTGNERAGDTTHAAEIVANDRMENAPPSMTIVSKADSITGDMSERESEMMS